MIESILIAGAMCIDALGLGITYGIKKIRIPLTSILIINVISTCILGLSMMLGYGAKHFISQTLASTISCTILIIIGLFFMMEGYIKYLAQNRKASNCNLLKIRVPRLSIIIDIAWDFTKADMDISGDISVKESIFLGMILALDSLAVGFGIALSEMNLYIFLALVFCMNMVSIFLGLLLGKKIDNYRANLKTSLLPGFIIFFMGILKGM